MAAWRPSLRLLLEFFSRDIIEILKQDILKDVGLHALVHALLDTGGKYREVVPSQIPEIQPGIRKDCAKRFIHNERIGREWKLLRHPGLHRVHEPRDDVALHASVFDHGNAQDPRLMVLKALDVLLALRQ